LPEMTGTELLAQTMHGYGTTHFFFVPTVGLKALPAMERYGILPVSAHGEKAAAYMADGYARASGKPGFCGAQSVGAANMAAGLKDAYMAGSPVVAITGGPAPATEGRSVYQEIREFSMYEPVTKWSARIEQVEQLPQLLREAYRRSTSGAPGPVYLEGRGHWAHVLDDTADMELQVDERFARVPSFRSEPEQSAVEAALNELAKAERPVIVAGGGVVQSGAEAALVAFAERLSIPVATSAAAKAAIPDAHPLAVGVVGGYARRCANDVLAAADCVLFVGSRTGSMVTAGWRIPAEGSATILHLDIDPLELGRAYHTEVALLADARSGLERLLASATGDVDRGAWLGRVSELVSAWKRQADEIESSDAVPIRPERIMADLSRVLPDDGVVVADTLQSSLWAGTFMRFRSPRQQFIRCAGSLGWGLPGAIGAQCAVGDRSVVCFTGDGALYYHMAELETAARYGIPVVVVLNNNGAYAGEKPLWDAAYQGAATTADPMWIFGDINFASIAKEMGCATERVVDPDRVGPAIAEAIAARRPALIDVVSDPNAVADKGWG
jgi:acetolactate synthase I/II/III large subunit